MTKNDFYKAFMALVRFCITGKAPNENVAALIDGRFCDLYDVSKELDFAHIVYSSLKKMNISIDEETEKKFKKAQKLAMYRATMIEYEQQSVASVLNGEGIPFVLLKGAVIRDLYPQNAIRTSCDIDVLVENESLVRSKELLEGLGYKIVQENSHDIPYVSPAGVKVELHFAITEEGLNKANELLKDAWSYTEKDEKGNVIFTKEFFLFHHFAHMAFHFKNGGCGLKPLVDLYVIETQMGVRAEDITDLLERADLCRFADQMTKLSRTVFGDMELTDFHYTLLSYIIRGGTYGRIDNKVALGKTKSKGTLKYILKRFFLPYNEMKHCYPILERLFFLLPIFWIVRVFHRLLSKDRNRFVTELNQSVNVTKEKLEDVREIQERMGL